MLSVGAASADAQSAARSPDGQAIVDTLRSDVLHEARVIQIFLPARYRVGSTDRYDVVYVVDGEMLASFFPPIRTFGEVNELIPPVIVVGITNNYGDGDDDQSTRERDLLPTHVAGSPRSGGAERFIGFLQSELLPYIARRYPTTGRNTLFGHSYGGLFTVYTLLTHPEIFDGYIASDPALWWNGGAVNTLAAERLGHLPAARRTLFVGGRSGRINEAFGIRQFTALLQAKAPSTLRWKSVASADEDHGSVRLKNIYDGLKFTYFGHSPAMLDFFPRDGILLDGHPIPILLYSTYLGEEPGIRYTTDGSEPTTSSARYEYGVELSGPAQLTLKQFSNWGPDKTVTGRFDVGPAVAPVPRPAGLTPGGLRYACDAGAANRPPAVNRRPSRTPPRTSGRAHGDFDVRHVGGGAPAGCAWDGYLQADQSGYYTFFLEADSAARLFLGGRLLISVDVARDRTGNKSFILPLTPGFHAIRVEYRHTTGDTHLDLTYLPPTADGDVLARVPIAIPSERQYAP